MQIDLVGGPFDGGTLEAPRRTQPGLSVKLQHAEMNGTYLLLRRLGRMTAQFVVESNVKAETAHTHSHGSRLSAHARRRAFDAQRALDEAVASR